MADGGGAARADDEATSGDWFRWGCTRCPVEGRAPTQDAATLSLLAHVAEGHDDDEVREVLVAALADCDRHDRG